MLTRTDALDISVKARQVTSASDAEERRAAAQDLEESINRLVIPAGGEATLSATALFQLARDYERLRLDLDSGSRRTAKLTRIVNGARARASLAPEAAQQAAQALLLSSRPGDRVVGLGLTQETGDDAVFESVLQLISQSDSAFEMYHALLALQEMSFGLTATQTAQALEVLERESTDPRSVGVRADPGLPTLIERTIRILNGEE